MKYISNDEFYQPGGPIFIYVGGEWAINEGFVLGGHTYDMAKELNGHLFYTEHRYYGETHPTENLEASNLQYLTLDQALEDLAHFIRFQKTQLENGTDSGVILVGGSYSATMVAWFRQRYPDLANGAWASSAPLLAKLDFSEYKEVVGKAVREVAGQPCYDRIERAFTQIKTALDQSDFASLDEAFNNTCSPLSQASELDIFNLLDTISHALSGKVQSHTGSEITNACAQIMRLDITDDLMAFAKFFGVQESGPCYDYSYERAVRNLNATAWGSDADSSWRQWFFQTCNEFGWYQTLNSTNQPFGEYDYAHLFVNLCNDTYDGLFPQDSVAENIVRTNENNLGMQPTFENVFSTHGSLDPWSSMGLSEAPNPSSPVVVIPGAAHCKDLASISSRDSAEMRAAKEQIQELVKEWLDY